MSAHDDITTKKMKQDIILYPTGSELPSIEALEKIALSQRLPDFFEGSLSERAWNELNFMERYCLVFGATKKKHRNE